jgi:hypothetical protein
MIAYMAQSRFSMGETMRRREFIALAGASVTRPFAAMAQEPGRMYRLGSLFPAPRSDPNFIAFFEGMSQYGFVEGQNLLDDPNGYGLTAVMLVSVRRVLESSESVVIQVW